MPFHTHVDPMALWRAWVGVLFVREANSHFGQLQVSPAELCAGLGQLRAHEAQQSLETTSQSPLRGSGGLHVVFLSTKHKPAACWK